MNRSVDVNAPLSARKEIMIQASPDRVWEVLTDIDHWPAWQADVVSAKLEGPLEVGSVFRWKAKGLAIVSTLHTVQTPTRIGWTGHSLGMDAIHNWTIEAQEGQTHLISQESLSGWLVRLLKLFDPNFLEKSLEASLQSLKAQAEQS